MKIQTKITNLPARPTPPGTFTMKDICSGTAPAGLYRSLLVDNVHILLRMFDVEHPARVRGMRRGWVADIILPSGTTAAFDPSRWDLTSTWQLVAADVSVSFSVTVNRPWTEPAAKMEPANFEKLKNLYPPAIPEPAFPAPQTPRPEPRVVPDFQARRANPFALAFCSGLPRGSHMTLSLAQDTGRKLPASLLVHPLDQGPLEVDYAWLRSTLTHRFCGFHPVYTGTGMGMRVQTGPNSYALITSAGHLPRRDNRTLKENINVTLIGFLPESSMAQPTS